MVRGTNGVKGTEKGEGKGTERGTERGREKNEKRGAFCKKSPLNPRKTLNMGRNLFAKLSSALLAIQL